jgi:hypothetical protein
MASRRLSQLWTAQRAAGWGYANKGDTRFAAERRLWRAQMTELRRNLQNEELVVRREAHLAAREKKAAFDAEQARHQPSPMAGLRKLEMQARLDLEREEADARRLERRTAAQEKEAFKRGAENKERLAWLEELQKDYSVDGSPPRSFSLDSRKKRAFLTPEVQARGGPAPPRPAPPRPAPPRPAPPRPAPPRPAPPRPAPPRPAPPAARPRGSAHCAARPAAEHRSAAHRLALLRPLSHRQVGRPRPRVAGGGGDAAEGGYAGR